MSTLTTRTTRRNALAALTRRDELEFQRLSLDYAGLTNRLPQLARVRKELRDSFATQATDLQLLGDRHRKILLELAHCGGTARPMIARSLPPVTVRSLAKLGLVSSEAGKVSLTERGWDRVAVLDPHAGAPRPEIRRAS